MRTVAVVVILMLAYLYFFQTRMIYFPRRTAADTISRFEAAGGRRVEFQTTQGHETAWLLPAAENRPPEHFWIVCAGNASEALSLADLQAYSGLREDAFLLVDYPGYGVSEGSPNPASILENLRKAVPLACETAGFPIGESGTRGVVFGHSLGAASALLAAEEFSVKRAVLLAPFTSSMEMTRVVLHLPLGWLVRHRFDNRARLATLAKRGGHAWIFHGSSDAVIPVAMGRELSSELGRNGTFHEVPGGDHNDLLGKARSEIIQAMHDARE